jgi:prepilin-type N-terminal cleavage/methylation domain-containing protein
MPTFSVGAISNRRKRGITLLELLIVMTLIALVVGLSFPSAAAGLDSMRLRSTADTVANFLNAAIDRAGRRQQVIEVWISPHDNLLIARSPDLEFNRRLEIPDVFRIVSVRPPAEVNPDEPRRFLFYPGGTIPAIGVEIASKNGRRRMVSIDPITASPHSELEP